MLTRETRPGPEPPRGGLVCRWPREGALTWPGLPAEAAWGQRGGRSCRGGTGVRRFRGSGQPSQSLGRRLAPRSQFFFPPVFLGGFACLPAGCPDLTPGSTTAGEARLWEAVTCRGLACQSCLGAAPVLIKCGQDCCSQWRICIIS